MTQKPLVVALSVALLGVSVGGLAHANRYLNNRYLNNRYLNNRYLNTSDTGATTGTVQMWNYSSGEQLYYVGLNGSTLSGWAWVCNAAGCNWQQRYGDQFVNTMGTATLSDGTATYTYIGGRIAPSAAEPNTSLYYVWTWAQDANANWTWLPACEDNYGNVAPAMPLQGAWDGTTASRSSNDPNKITWACSTGALGKCAATGLDNTLGYAPWENNWYYTTDSTGNWVSVTGQKIHQTCTRMIRADYCGDGVSHTETGTAIDVTDELYYYSSRLAADTYKHNEALWTEKGAFWLSCSRLGAPDMVNFSCSNGHQIMKDKITSCMTTLPSPEAAVNQSFGQYNCNGGGSIDPLTGYQSPATSFYCQIKPNPTEALFGNTTSMYLPAPW